MNIVEVRSTTLDKLTFGEITTLIALLSGVDNRGDLVEPALKELRTVAGLRLNQLRLEEDYRKYCELPPARDFGYLPKHGQVMVHSRREINGVPFETWSADFGGIETRVMEGEGRLSDEFKAAADIEADTMISITGCQTGRVQCEVPNFSAHPGQCVGHGEKPAVETRDPSWKAFTAGGEDAWYGVRAIDGSLHVARAFACTWTGKIQFVTERNVVLFDAVVTDPKVHERLVARAKAYAYPDVRGEAANPLIEDDVMVIKAEPVKMRMFDAATLRSYDPVEEDDCDSPTVVE